MRTQLHTSCKPATCLSSSKIVILLPPASFYQTIGKPFTELAETESTNNYAMHMAQNGLAGHGAAWFARHQTAGKGQRGKSWKDEPGQNISLSVLLDTTVLPVSQPFCNTSLANNICESCRNPSAKFATAGGYRQSDNTTALYKNPCANDNCSR